MSRLACQGASASSPMRASAVAASSALSGFGTERGSLGVRTAASAPLLAKPRRSRKRKNPRKVESARAVELRSRRALARVAR